MKNSKEDIKFMAIALEEAKKAFKSGNLPVGAVLVIDGKLKGSSGTYQESNGWFNHAENILIQKYAQDIKSAIENSKKVCVYTTLEPCLMCFGTIVHNRVSRIVYACPDLAGGSTQIKAPTKWYKDRWPIIEQGPFKKESLSLIQKWKEGAWYDQ